MENTAVEIGRNGEEIAKQFLLEKGYKILETNWHFGHKEIDIIASKENTLSIVEVKTRAGMHFDKPFTAVTRQKQKLLIQAANAYVEKKDIDMNIRFDIVSIIITNKEPKIEFLEDAFYPLI